MPLDHPSSSLSPESSDNAQASEIERSRSQTHRLLRGGRRAFLGRVGLFTASTAVAGVAGPALLKAKDSSAEAEVIAAYAGEQFPSTAYKVRITAAERLKQAVAKHPTNGDEAKYANKIATDTRGLPHNELGEVDLKAYQSFIDALRSGDPENYEKIILGGKRKLVQPLTPLAVSLTGLSPAHIPIPVPPTLDSAQQAAEFIEIAWQGLLQDVPFSDYRNDTNNPLILAAVNDLNRLSDFRGPKEKGRITPELLFRGTAFYSDASGRAIYRTVAGADTGPYVSQFLLRPVPSGTLSYPQLHRVPVASPENSFQVNYDEWLLVQNGGDSGRTIKFDSVRRYFINGRDQGEIAHTPPPVYTNAAQILIAKPAKDNPLAGGIGAPYNPSNPYNKSKTQVGGSGTFGPGYAQGLISLVGAHAIRAAYWQKYYVHRRLRSEAFGGLVHNNKVKKTNYPIHPDVFKSEALDRLYSANKTYLLPQFFPEGSPFHSSYPGGASVTAGASVTILKALFDGDYVIPNPVIPDPKDPTKLIPYEGPPLTVEGELNKLAANIGLGRNSAGIHWRTDASASLALGEAVAIAILKDEGSTFREIFNGFTFTKFDGTKVTV